MSSARAPESAHGRILWYVPFDADLESALLAALELGQVTGGVELKPGRVWRLGEATIKLYRASGALRDRLRRPGAIRAARVARRVGVEATPRVLAAAWQSGFLRAGPSVLATEYVEGLDLGQILLAEDVRAFDAFPTFLADLHARGVHHGDFHPWQLLWDGERWVLLDLDGVRHPLRALRREHLELEAWGRLHFYARAFVGSFTERSLAPLFARYYELRRPGRDVEVAWRQVEALAERFGRSRRTPAVANE